MLVFIVFWSRSLLHAQLHRWNRVSCQKLTFSSWECQVCTSLPSYLPLTNLIWNSICSQLRDFLQCSCSRYLWRRVILEVHFFGSKLCFQGIVKAFFDLRSLLIWWADKLPWRLLAVDSYSIRQRKWGGRLFAWLYLWWWKSRNQWWWYSLYYKNKRMRMLTKNHA